jgi:hypothetical protein
MAVLGINGGRPGSTLVRVGIPKVQPISARAAMRKTKVLATLVGQMGACPMFNYNDRLIGIIQWKN